MNNELVYQSPRVYIKTLEFDIAIATGSVEVQNLQDLELIEESW